MKHAETGRRVTVTPPDDVDRAGQSSWRWAALLVLPYLLLSLAWVFTNPPGAAPDEPDNLVKALGSRTLTAGEAGPPAATDEPSLLVKRNASITRLYDIPGRLAGISDFTCYAFKPTVTAACLPDDPPQHDGSVVIKTPIGAYPPFLYVPVGWVASLAESPQSSFVLARLAVTAISSFLLLVGVRHLIRWLGRSAVIGVVAVLTPMALFTMSVVSLSGIELTAALAVAAVVAVAMRRPASVHAPSTHWTLLAAGAFLALSRQLGVVTLAAFVIVLLVVTGWDRVKRLLLDRQRSFVVTVAALFVSAVAVVWWELTYDHPADVGPVINRAAVTPFIDGSYDLMRSAIGKFGWLDTPLPGLAVGMWISIWLGTLVVGALAARRRDFWLIVAGLIATWILSYFIYASVFFTVGAGVQGRQFLPFATFAFVVSGAVLADRLPNVGQAASDRFFILVGVAAGFSQAYAIYWNARRYAVGTDGPLWFFSEAAWSPVLGWPVWILLGCLGGGLLTYVTIRYRPGSPSGAQQESLVHHVAR
ncbi:DUF2142 domain-containing protein [Aeromicrobium sp. CFBP 8757]|uniref:DUF2142 domain-containing protein n=1 Tax=Aeromicrobium sp. CFBP 8757 TaxID=2775288 RepID=UPI0017824D93|nr:DUF2142 domain-containing protein [Aeromicrobium sp. CFBP 8757]